MCFHYIIQKADLVTSPVPVNHGIHGLESTDPTSVNTMIFIQSYDPRPVPVDMLFQAMTVYDWSLWSIIFGLLIVVSIVWHKIKSNYSTRRRTRRMREKFKKTRVKRLRKAMANVFLTIIDESNFEARNFKEIALLGLLMISVFIITRVALNLIGTQMIRADIQFYTELADLDGSSPDDVAITWLANGYALQYFQNPSNQVANRILKSRENLNSIQDVETVLENSVDNRRMMLIEDDMLIEHLVPLFCKMIKYPLKVTHVQQLQTPFGVTFNSRLNDTVKRLIRES